MTVFLEVQSTSKAREACSDDDGLVRFGRHERAGNPKVALKTKFSKERK